MKRPTREEFERELDVFGKTQPAAQGWDLDSIALGFALACGCEAESFAVVEELRGRTDGE